MSKAEERALEAYPKETRDITGFVVAIGQPQYIRDLYIEGYHQAEKDLELGWEDIKMVIEIVDKLISDNVNGIIDNGIEWYYKEILKWFKKRKDESKR